MTNEEFMKEYGIHNEYQIKIISEMIKQEGEIKWIYADLGKQTIQVEKGISVQRIIDFVNNNGFNPLEWSISHVIPEDIEIEISNSCGRFEKDRCAELKYGQ